MTVTQIRENLVKKRALFTYFILYCQLESFVNSEIQTLMIALVVHDHFVLSREGLLEY